MALPQEGHDKKPEHVASYCEKKELLLRKLCRLSETVLLIHIKKTTGCCTP
jgi:hypothetical protein